MFSDMFKIRGTIGKKESTIIVTATFLFLFTLWWVLFSHAVGGSSISPITNECLGLYLYYSSKWGFVGQYKN